MRISIDGNIGAGKSSVLRHLAEKWETRLEPVEEWANLMRLMYADPVRWSTAFNINVLLGFSEHPAEPRHNVVVSERSPLSSLHVFAVLQKDLGHMTDLETDLVRRVYDRVAWIPDAIVYLRTSPQVAYQRMQTRNRAEESTVTLDYIQSVHDYYERLMASSAMGNARVVTVDADQDGVAVQEAVDQAMASLTAQ